jgi:hypothetical protein
VYCYHQLQARCWLSSGLEAGPSDDFVQFVGGLGHLLLSCNRVEILGGAARKPYRSSTVITYSSGSMAPNRPSASIRARWPVRLSRLCFEPRHRHLRLESVRRSGRRTCAASIEPPSSAGLPHTAGRRSGLRLRDPSGGRTWVTSRKWWKLLLFGAQNTTRSEIHHAVQSTKSTPSSTSRMRLSPATLGGATGCGGGEHQRQAG